VRVVGGRADDSTGADAFDARRRVLIVSGDVGWLARVGDLFVLEDLVVSHCTSGANAIDELIRVLPDLVLLDLTLPDRYGPTVCSLLRAASTVPIMAVGAKADETDVISALAAGADAFALKGDRGRELLARCRALLRRVPPCRSRSTDEVSAGPVRLVRAARQLFVYEHLIPTTRREFDIIEVLISHAGRIVGREELMTPSWGPKAQPSTLDVHIRRLRAKIEVHDPSRRIETVRGVGFRFVLTPAGPTSPTIDVRDRATCA
jgi:two-component system response regulator RegX3